MSHVIDFGTIDLDSDGQPVAQTVTLLNPGNLPAPEFMALVLADPRNVAPPGLTRMFRQHWRYGRLVRLEVLFIPERGLDTSE